MTGPATRTPPAAGPCTSRGTRTFMSDLTTSPRDLHGLFTSKRHGRREVINLEDVLTVYSIALFLHIAGALGVFAALALDWVGIANLRRARTVDQIREWVGVYAVV